MRTLGIHLGFVIVSFWVLSAPSSSYAATEGSISGSVLDPQGVALVGALVKLSNINGSRIKETRTSQTGEFNFFPVIIGDYQVEVSAEGFLPYRSVVHVASGGTTQVEAHLEMPASGKEMVLEVKAKRHLVQNSASVSSTEVNQGEIQKLPQGSEISLPRLLTTTSPGAVQGAFGQVFFRGNHANIQYQIDGVQLPDSPSNTFGQAFSPRNIDHMEVITGGIPAEYGERLAAVVNIVTKSGPETPGGEVELNYGSYNYTSPHFMYGGSNSSGSLHYFLSANLSRTDRGLDTPQPVSESDPTQGGTDAIHDQAYGNSEFAKIDWLADNENKLSWILFNNENHYQIPNYPSSFKPTDPFFQPQSGFADIFGNGSFNYVPPQTNDTQGEANAYLQAVWKHTFSEAAFLQVAPYYKYSNIRVDNDPANDLSTANGQANAIPGATPSSFSEDRHTNNLGLKTDLSLRPNDRNLVKTGFQIQGSRSTGIISVQTVDNSGNITAPVQDSNPVNGFFEAAYVQDDLTIAKPLILNLGLRFDATQFKFADLSPTDSLFQPRIGLNYLATETTKLHIFYGKLFQPAPAENLRDTFLNSGAGSCPAGQLCPYDIKAEKDDYYEIGIAQQFADQHAASLNVYYKNATNMLDDAQLLNTSIAQPYNFAKGYAYGVEFAIKGQINEDWSDYLNYSYEIAKGQGISGGIFTGVTPTTDYQFLDHVQIHTANAGLSYSKNYFWGTAQGLFGSGLRTGDNNTNRLPSHFSLDLTSGYEFHGDTWLSRFKLSADVLNVFNNVYPITVANGFNGSHYAAGREFIIHLTKSL